MQSFEEDIKLCVPKHLTAERMMRVSVQCLNKTPKLLECDPMSVFNAIITCSQLGLEPGVLGRAYLIPFGKECQLIIGYQGLVDLARRSGRLISIQAHVVHANDTFEFAYGIDDVLVHKPLLDGDPGAPRLVYGIAKLKDGGHQIEVMSISEIEKIRKAAPSSKGKSPWDNFWEEMAKKTVIRRLCKLLPMSVEFQTAMERDETSIDEVPGLKLDWNKAAAIEAGESIGKQTIPIDSLNPSPNANRGHDESMSRDRITQSDIDKEIERKRRAQEPAGQALTEEEMQAETARQLEVERKKEEEARRPKQTPRKSGGWE